MGSIGKYKSGKIGEERQGSVDESRQELVEEVFSVRRPKNVEEVDHREFDQQRINQLGRSIKN